MAIYTHGWESDPRRDGCDSCQDLRNELADMKVAEKVWRRAFNELSERFRALEALHGSCPAPDTSSPAHTRE